MLQLIVNSMSASSLVQFLHTLLFSLLIETYCTKNLLECIKNFYIDFSSNNFYIMIRTVLFLSQLHFINFLIRAFFYIFCYGVSCVLLILF